MKKTKTLHSHDEIDNDDSYDLIDRFVKHYGLMSFHLDSYNDFVENGINQIIDENKHITVTAKDQTYKIEFGDLVINSPVHKEINERVKKIYPKKCTERDISYISNIFIDVLVKTPLGTKRLHKNVHIGSIPTMIKSKLCNLYKIKHDMHKLAKLREDFYDNGGYFILKGSKKVIACQQQSPAYNMICVFSKRKRPPKYDLYSEVRSIAPIGSHSTTVQVGHYQGLISVVVPYIDMEAIPIGIIFKALGAKDEEEMLFYILGKQNERSKYYRQVTTLIVPSFEQTWECNSQDMALHYIGRRGKKFSKSDRVDAKESQKKLRENAISYARHLLAAEFLPHIGIDDGSFVRKRYFVGHMVKKLLDAKLGRIPTEDRDHFANKRVDTTGYMLKSLFYSAFKRLTNYIYREIERCLLSSNSINIVSIIKPGIISNILYNAISNNVWARGKVNGISQTYDAYNYAAYLDNGRKISITIAKDGGKVVAQRQQHNSNWGIICPFGTPEGAKVGLVNVASIGCLISIGSDSKDIIEILRTMRIVPFEKIDATKNKKSKIPTTKIFVNGNIIGATSYPHQIVKKLRNMRRKYSINYEISISYDELADELHILTDPGRPHRPLYIVEDGELKIKKKHIIDLRAGKLDDKTGNAWLYFLYNGIIEFLDKTEEENTFIAVFPDEFYALPKEERKLYTHCEIHPTLIFGVGANLIPFMNHNQAPRNTYQSAMGKQAIGIPGTNYRFKTKGKFYALNYPQKRITTTRMANILGFDHMSAGQNIITAICPWYGLNQEDSIIMNKDSLDRGLFSTTAFLCYKGKVRKDKGELFEVPKESECNQFKGNSSKLDILTGIVTLGQIVEEGDILIGITINEDKNETHDKKKKSISVVYDHPWPGRVHYVKPKIAGDGYPEVRIVIAQQRPPIVGDKFSAMHGQKGTIGAIYRSIDLMFDEQGISPDAILNPLAFPSRMTIGMLIEMQLGIKVASGNYLHNIKVKDVFCLDDKNHKNPKEDKGYSKRMKDAFKKEIIYSSSKSVGDASPFNKKFDSKKLDEELKKLGINNFGERIMYNGQTGEQMKALIFVGINYHQRLKHMVIDKIHARARGGRTRLTHQPFSGRNRGGGFRVGTMEKDNLLAQGMSWFAKDRLMEQSDETREWFCCNCGLPAIVNLGNPDRGIPPRKECRVCEDNEVVLVRLPYGTKLLMQELIGMNIVVRVMTKPFKDTLIGDKVEIILPKRRGIKGVIVEKNKSQGEKGSSQSERGGSSKRRDVKA